MSWNYSEWSRDGWNWMYSLNRQEWLILLVLCLALGFLCLRGFGSRTDY